MIKTLFIALILVSVAYSQINAGNAWEGTWSNSKRSAFGGSLFVCVNPQTNVASGTYGNGGYMDGYLSGDTWEGQWYEAGYDKPFGTFSVVLTGTTFNGSWSYYNGPQNDPNTVQNGIDGNSFSFSGSRSSSATPSIDQCQAGAQAGSPASGSFDNNVDLCYFPLATYQDTNQAAFTARFNIFNVGSIAGYSPDGGRTVLLSDFDFPDDDDVGNNTLKYRPENNDRPFGTSFPADATQDDDENQTDDDFFFVEDDDIQTANIVVARLVDQNTVCFNIWKGFYNELRATRCLERTNSNEPDAQACGLGGRFGVAVQAFDDNLSNAIISKINSFAEQLTLPEVYIYVDDDGDIIDDGDDEPESSTDVEEEEDDDDNSSTSLYASFVLMIAALAFLMF